MVLLALVIVSFKVSDFGTLILKTLQNADSDIWPRTWETFWTTASKGKKVPGSSFCEIRILSGGQHNYVHRTWLHTMWRVSFPKCQISCILDIFTLKLQICAHSCLVQVSSLSSKASKTLQSNVRMFLCQKMIECLFSSHIHTHAQEESELNGISWWWRKGLVPGSRMVEENCFSTK